MSTTAQPLVKIIDLNLIQAFDQWAVQRGMRGRDIADTIAKVMRYWVSFAIAKIPKADAEKVRSHLKQIVTAYSKIESGNSFRLKRQRSVANAYRGTLAAAVVFALDYKGARKLAGGRDPAFYGVVGQYINARAYSVGIHRSGFAPALRLLNQGGPQPDTQRLPKYQHPTGRMAHQFNDDLARILVENFASSADKPGRPAKGIVGIAGGVFDSSLKEVENMVGGFLTDNLVKAAEKAGFHTKQFNAALARMGIKAA